MVRWSSFGAAVVVVAAIVGLVVRDWWRYPVLDPRLGYSPRDPWQRPIRVLP